MSGSCLACSAGVRVLGQRRGWSYGVCVRCGAVQLMSPPTDEELERLYRTAYHLGGHYSEDPSKHARERSRVVEQLAGLVAQVGKVRSRALVVELGAGWGALGDALVRRGLDYVGIEPNEEMAAHARSRGLDVRTGSIDRLEEQVSRKVDVFVSMAVYEHLLHQVDTLRRQAALLAPGGAIIIQAPTAGIPSLVGRLVRELAPTRELPEVFGSLAPPWHVLLPTPRTIEIQAAAAGLRLESVRVSFSGRRDDWRRWLQVAVETTGRAGHKVLGRRWPMSMAHIYVLRALER